MLFLLTPFGLIPNLNKLFRELMQAGIPFEPNDVLMLFFFTEVYSSGAAKPLSARTRMVLTGTV